MTKNMETIHKLTKQQYLDMCRNVTDCDAVRLSEILDATMSYYAGDQTDRDGIRESRKAEAEWYESLKTGNPLYSVYGEDFYLAEVWACWRVYSRKYIHTIQSPKSLTDRSILEDLGDLKRIVDVGCGAGMTCAAWKELFPSAEVIGTNLAGTRQMALAKALGEERGFSMADANFKVKGSGGLVFASEYFEHFERPIDELNEIIATLRPDKLIIANAFGAISIGHFHQYRAHGQSYDGKAMSRVFNNTLWALGYEKVKTKLWNNRPAYWRRVEK